MDILDDIGVSKLSAKVFSKVNYSFKMFTGNAALAQSTALFSLTLTFYFTRASKIS